MTYKEKLLDPRWQKCRLEVFERDNFSCRYCGDTETTLHVHHVEYIGDPWDTPIEKLLCLCRHCHSAEELVKKIFQSHLVVKCIKQNYENRYVFLNLLVQSPKKPTPHLIIALYDQKDGSISHEGGVRSDELLKIAEEINKING